MLPSRREERGRGWGGVSGTGVQEEVATIASIKTESICKKQTQDKASMGTCTGLTVEVGAGAIGVR